MTFKRLIRSWKKEDKDPIRSQHLPSPQPTSRILLALNISSCWSRILSALIRETTLIVRETDAQSR
jgi:hypothetical protein